MLCLDEGRSERIEEGGDHVNPEAIVGGAGEPAHVGPVGGGYDQVTALHSVPPIATLNLLTLGISPYDAVTTSVSLHMTGQPGADDNDMVTHY